MMKSRSLFWWCSLAMLIIIGITYLYFFHKKGVLPGANSAKAAATPLPVIHIAHDNWPGFAVADIARDSAYCTKVGIECDVTITNDYDEIIAGLKSGKYDVAAGLSTAYFDIANNDNSSDFKIIIATDQSIGSDGIIARPEAPLLSQNPHPVFASDFIYAFLIGEVLKRYNRDITSAHFATGSVDESASLKLLREKKADYHATHEPYLSQARNEGMRVEYTSEQDPGIITDVLVASGEALRKKHDLLQKFTKAYFLAERGIASSPGDAVIKIASAYKISQSPLAEELVHVKFLDQSANKRTMETTAGYGSLPNIIRGAALTRTKRRLNVYRNEESMIDRSFVSEAN